MLARIPEKDRESASEWLLEKFAAVLGESLKEMVQEEVQKQVKST